MAERSARSSEMFWVTAWWVAALVAAVLVFFILSLLISDDPAAGLVFGGVTFVLVGLLMVYFGPGPAADTELAPGTTRRCSGGRAEPRRAGASGGRLAMRRRRRRRRRCRGRGSASGCAMRRGPRARRRGRRSAKPRPSRRR